MADFDDITGWEEEYTELRDSGQTNSWITAKVAEYNADNPDPKRKRYASWPLSQARHFVELLVVHDEFAEALRQNHRYGEAYVEVEARLQAEGKFRHDPLPGETIARTIREEYGPEWQHPSIGLNRIADFYKWFRFKADFYPHDALLDLMNIATQIASGEADSFDSPGVWARLKQGNQYLPKFDLGSEG